MLNLPSGITQIKVRGENREVLCSECKQPFLVSVQNPAKTCSASCGEARKRRLKLENPYYKKNEITKNCQHCQKPFKVDNNNAPNRKYCSYNCSKKANQDNRIRLRHIRKKAEKFMTEDELRSEVRGLRIQLKNTETLRKRYEDVKNSRNYFKRMYLELKKIK